MGLANKVRSKFLLQGYRGLINPGERVLDVGSGTGIIGRAICRASKSDITGIDVFDYKIDDFPFQKFDGWTIPFEDNAFDVVMFNDVMHHIRTKNQIRLLQESKRVGQRIIIADYDTDDGKLLLYIVEQIFARLYNPFMDIPMNFRNRDAWDHFFDEAGLTLKRVIKVKPRGLYPLRHALFVLE